MTDRRAIRLQWGLRTMLAVTLVAGMFFGLVSRRARFVSRCDEAGWRVLFEFECDETGRPNVTFNRASRVAVLPTPRGPEFLRESLGLAYFNRVRGVHMNLHTEADRQLFHQLPSQQSITFLRIDQGEFKADDVETVAALTNLRALRLDVAAMAADEIRGLKERLHPACELYIRRMEPPTE